MFHRRENLDFRESERYRSPGMVMDLRREDEYDIKATGAQKVLQVPE